MLDKSPTVAAEAQLILAVSEAGQTLSDLAACMVIPLGAELRVQKLAGCAAGLDRTALRIREKVLGHPIVDQQARADAAQERADHLSAMIEQIATRIGIDGGDGLIMERLEIIALGVQDLRSCGRELVNALLAKDAAATSVAMDRMAEAVEGWDALPEPCHPPVEQGQ